MSRPLNPAAIRVAAGLKTHPVGTRDETLASALRNKRYFEGQMLTAIAEYFAGPHTDAGCATVRHCMREYQKYADLHTILWREFCASQAAAATRNAA